MKKAILGIFTLLCFANPLKAQDTVDVFGGYSYVWGSVDLQGFQLCPGPTCPSQAVTGRANLNGWEASGVYKIADSIGVEADFGGNYGTFSGSGASTIHRETYLFGPQFSYNGRLSPFVHFLFGGAHETNGSGSVSGLVIPAGSTSSFAMVFGGGIDIKVLPSVSFRAIQLDYLSTRFNSAWQSQPRVSAGIAFHF